MAIYVKNKNSFIFQFQLFDQFHFFCLKCKSYSELHNNNYIIIQKI